MKNLTREEILAVYAAGPGVVVPRVPTLIERLAALEHGRKGLLPHRWLFLHAAQAEHPILTALQNVFAGKPCVPHPFSWIVPLVLSLSPRFVAKTRCGEPPLPRQEVESEA